ncbi:putative disease resistance proteinisoform X2 [Salvia divinorum]|uniref:Disease resistance proteinisoform X2 n=1 Tax=Salvia divinorum TaxID=28513 RepID=A0ABD1GWS0_SALDI
MLECEIEHDPMGILGKLHTLRELYLGPKSFVGEEMTSPASSFPLLKTVSLVRLPNWRVWKVEQGAMPLVAEITIGHCPRFEKIPEGFSSIQTLQKLVIYEVPRLKKRILGSGQGGVDHVPLIIINKCLLSKVRNTKKLSLTRGSITNKCHEVMSSSFGVLGKSSFTLSGS